MLASGLQAQHSAPADSTVFHAVLRHAITLARDTALRVDASPTGNDLRGATPDVPETSPGFVATRRRIISSLGLPEAGDLSVMQRTCAGGLFPAPDDRAADSLRAGCPKTVFHVLAVGTPRQGTAIARDGVYHGELHQASRGLLAVRVIRREFAPGGQALTYFDYVLRRDSGRLTVVRVIPLLYVE